MKRLVIVCLYLWPRTQLESRYCTALIADRTRTLLESRYCTALIADRTRTLLESRYCTALISDRRTQLESRYCTALISDRRIVFRYMCTGNVCEIDSVVFLSETRIVSTCYNQTVALFHNKTIRINQERRCTSSISSYSIL